MTSQVARRRNVTYARIRETETEDTNTRPRRVAPFWGPLLLALHRKVPDPRAWTRPSQVRTRARAGPNTTGGLPAVRGVFGLRRVRI